MHHHLTSSSTRLASSCSGSSPVPSFGASVFAPVPVTTVTRDVFERYFEVTPVTVVTGTGAKTDASNDRTGDLPVQLDAKRVEELVRWWCTRTKQLREELSPAQVEGQARKELRETLAEQVRESALDAEVNRIVKAATPSAKKRSRR